MKHLWFLLAIFASCSNRGVDNQTSDKAKPQINLITSIHITLLDAYQKTTTGGKERADGKHTSTSYTMVLLKGAQVSLEKVYLFGEKRDFETVDYEGKFYLIIQVFPEEKDQVRGERIQTVNAADIFYMENGVLKNLGVPKFFTKDAVIGN
jgi:hypothetical protein